MTDRPVVTVAGTVKARAGGFTLTELLIASAVLGIVLTTVAALLFQSYRAYGVTETVSERTQTYELVAQTMKYDLGLAGFKGTLPSDLTADFGGSEPIEVTATASGDSITVRYYENRLFDDGSGTRQLVEVTYYAANGNLYRVESGEDDVIFPGVNRVEVITYIDRGSGTESSVTMPAAFSAVTVEVEFSNGDVGSFVIPVDNIS